MARRCRVGLIAGLAFSLSLPAAPGLAVQPSPQSLEYSVKASYLVRFAAFVDWPPRVFADARSPVVICVVGRDPFGQQLDRAAAAQTAHGRALQVRRPDTPARLAGCQLIYIGEGGGQTARGARTQPSTLVVTDANVSNERGMIHFAVSESRVRFHIDKQAATRSGLLMSSRLLNLALTVREG